jgi:hypothetical protein
VSFKDGSNPKKADQLTRVHGSRSYSSGVAELIGGVAQNLGHFHCFMHGWINSQKSAAKLAFFLSEFQRVFGRMVANTETIVALAAFYLVVHEKRRYR